MVDIAKNVLIRFSSRRPSCKRNLHQVTNPNRRPTIYRSWLDDYVLVELDNTSRLEAAETALRLAMTLTFSHTTILSKKFPTQWDQMIHYLGLDWRLITCTVYRPNKTLPKL